MTAAATTALPTTNLPGQVTSFVGRDDELVELGRLLVAERMVTVTGPGGCGKTRLAVEIAARLAERWPDGVWWVDLAPVGDAQLVAEVAASTLRLLVDPGGGPLRALAVQLRERRLLLCLDNCEHLLDACAELTDALLRCCPGVTILATSREPVGVAGEAVWQVPSLAGDQAVRLFAQRSALVRPGFAVDGTNAHTVAAVCEELDRLPLAIELAAAWVRTLSPAQILRGLDDRFGLLARGPRLADERQGTLIASVDWSHDLLDDTDRVVLRRLALFAGGFTLEAAETVCGSDPLRGRDVLPSLGRLVDKSLVVAEHTGEATRYRLLETIRQYARQRLDDAGEADSTRSRHLDHYLALAEEAAPRLQTVELDHWLTVLGREHDNLRGALDGGLDAAPPTAARRVRRLADALSRLWFLRGHAHEGIDYLTRAIELDGNDRSEQQSRLYAGLAGVAAIGGQTQVLAEASTRGAALAADNGDDRSHGRCMAFAAYLGYFTDFAGSRRCAIEARRLAEAADDPVAGDLGLLLEALSWTNCSRHAQALPLLLETAERSARHGDRFVGVFACHGLLYAALFGGDVRRAVELGTRALELAEPLGDYFAIGSARSNLAWAKSVAGELDQARALMRDVVGAMDGAGPDVDIPPLAWTVAKAELFAGNVAAAIDWATLGLQYAAPTSDNLVVAWSRPVLASALRRAGRVAEAREQAERAVALGRRLNVPHVVADGLDEQAFLTAADDPARAEDLHHAALAVRREFELRTFYADSLDALARLAARSESNAEAVRLIAAGDAARDAMGYPRPPIAASDHGALLTQLRSALGNAYEAAYGEGAALGLDDAVAYATRARGRRDRPSTGWESLTPTELEVVRAVVDGLTNPDIAARLFVSRATVKTHLTHIYAKLGLANRTELAAAAACRRAGPP